MLKKILVAVAVVAGLVAGIGLARGSDWRVERALAMKAKPETVLPLLTATQSRSLAQKPSRSAGSMPQRASMQVNGAKQSASSPHCS